VKKYTLLVLLFAAVVAMLPNSVLFPATGDIAQHLHVPVSFVGLMITTYSIAYVISTPFLGVLSDRMGRRLVLVGGLLLFTVGGLVPLLTSNGTLILAGRLVMGVGSAGILPMTDSLIGDIYEAGPARRAALAGFGAALAVADALVPFAGGVLDTWYWRAVFAVYGLGIFAAVLCFFIVVPRRPESHHETFASYLNGLKVASRIPSLIGALICAVWFGLVYFGICSLLPLAISGGQSGLTNGILFLPIGVGWVATSAYLSKKSHLPKVHTVSGLAALGLVGLTLWMSVLHSIIPLLLVALGWGIGASLMTTLYSWVIGDDTPEAVRGAMNAVYNAAYVLGFSVGAPLFMGLKQWLGYQAATTIAACTLLGSVVVSFTLLRGPSLRMDGVGKSTSQTST
jgi:MFS transporter, ACDE family, multidrug resistance protein